MPARPATPNASVVIATTRTGFEAETVAEALRARGIPAQVTNVVNAELWSGALGGASVLVLQTDEDLARAALADMRTETANIDWDEQDIGPEMSDPALFQARRARRWAITVSIVLVPLGLFVLSIGTQRVDTMIQLLGGAVVLLAIVIALGLNATNRDEPTPPS